MSEFFSHRSQSTGATTRLGAKQVSERELHVSQPAAPCRECIEGVRVQYDGEAGGLTVFCPHNGAGGIYSIATADWIIWTPRTREQFERAVLGMAGKIIGEAGQRS